MNSRSVFCSGLCLCLLLFCATYAVAAKAKNILIVHSYCLDSICGAPQAQGVLESLAKAGFVEGKNLNVEHYAMDTRRVNNSPQLIAEQAGLVLQKVHSSKPDVLVLLDDNAIRTIGLKLVDSDINIVFSGMNAQPEDYNSKVRWMESRSKPGHNITSVYEKLHFIAACKVQKKVVPGLEKILIISDESPTGRAVIKQIKKEVKEKGSGLDIDLEFRIAFSWEEYIEALKLACEDKSIGTIYPAATLLIDKNGKGYSTLDIIKWTVANCQTPGIPINYSFARLGLLGGAGVDFIAMGRQAGKMVVEILKGVPPGYIPIEDAQRYALVFNLKRAKELGMEIPTDILMAADVIYK